MHHGMGHQRTAGVLKAGSGKVASMRGPRLGRVRTEDGGDNISGSQGRDTMCSPDLRASSIPQTLSKTQLPSPLCTSLGAVLLAPG